MGNDISFVSGNFPKFKPRICRILPLLLTGEDLHSKIETERNYGEFVDLRALMDVNFLGHLILMRVFGKGFFWR